MDVPARSGGAPVYSRLRENFFANASGRIRPTVPGTLPGRIELTLRFANGTQVIVHGRSLALVVADGARFAPDLSC